MMTDIEGSTALWERDPKAMSKTLAQHDRLFERLTTKFRGELVKKRGEGDSMFCVFASAGDAVACAWEIRSALQGQAFATAGVAARMAIHTGEPEMRGEDYYGSAVNRCARLRSAVSAGQLALSQTTKLIVERALPEGAALRELGTHRLRDLLRPEKIYELFAPGEPPFPPLRSLNRLPNNLPVQLTSFVGRQRELGEVIGLVHGHRLVSVLGMGGTGKTRLALQAAAELVEEFPDGVWLVELAAVHPGSSLTTVVAEQTGMASGEDDVSLQVLEERLADKELLLVLDNCEHMVDQIADLVTPLLRACPAIRILATTCEQLRVAGEVLYRIPPLELPEDSAAGNLEDIALSESMMLFLERARLKNSSFRLTPENASAVISICRRLDGIPLAIEHASSSTSMLSPAQILERWRDGFPVLQGDDRSSVQRHETLKSCFDWSFGMLSEPEQGLFLAQAVFRGGWNINAAEAICGDRSEVLPLLGKLISKSFVQAAPGRESEMRYSYLEPVRLYALAKQPPDDELRLRHATHFAKEVDQSEGARGGREFGSWIRLVDEDYANVVEALNWSSNAAAELFVRIVCSMRQYWLAKGRLREGREWMSKALSSAGSTTAQRALIHRAIGAYFLHADDLVQARQAFEESMRLDPLPEPAGAAAIRLNLGIVACREQEFEEGTRYLEESLELFREIGDRRGIATALLNIGVSQRHLGAQERAVTLLREAKAVFEELGDASMRASTLANLAVAYRTAGEHDKGLESLSEAFAVWESTTDITVMVGGLRDLIEYSSLYGDEGAAAIVQGICERLQQEHGVTIAGLPEAEATGRAREIELGRSIELEEIAAFCRSLCSELQRKRTSVS